MADWKDFVEDNRERDGQLLDSLEARHRPQVEPSPPPVLHCPVCLNAFYSDDSLEAHITQVHGPQHVYLRVNGSIIREVAWAERGIQTISVVLLGHPQAKVQIHAGAARKTLTAESEASLQQHVPKGFEGELHIDVEPEGGRRRAFSVYCHSLPEFRQDDIDCRVQTS